MKIEEFEKWLTGVMQRDTTVMMGRSAVYSLGDDKFYNFRRAAGVLESTPEEAALGMALKHLVSVIDIVEDLEYNPSKQFSAEYYGEVISEKFTDLRNYLYLIEGMLTERIAPDESPSR